MPSASSSRDSQLGDPSVDLVANAQQDRGQRGRDEQGSDEDGQLDAVVALGARTEGELADEQRDGEADAGEQGEPEDVAPGELVVEPGPGEAGHELGRAEDADDLADDQPGDDAEATASVSGGP